MKKSYIILFAFLIGVFLISGCSKNSGQTGNEENQQEGQFQQNQIQQQEEFNKNFEEVSLSDLTAGQKILVMGTENDDGSVSANQIIIGDDEVDFKNMMGPMRELSKDNGDAEQNFGDQSMPGPRSGGEGFSGEGADFDPRNMSEEERAEFRERMQERSGENGGNAPRGNAGSGTTRLQGEIMSKGDATLTLKIEGEGSKLIFYSEETKILKAKEDSSE